MLSGGLCLVSLASQLVPAARAAETGVISGSVSNSATHNLLEGAVVSLPALSLSVLTDNSGRYSLSGVPAGTHELVVTYLTQPCRQWCKASPSKMMWLFA